MFWKKNSDPAPLGVRLDQIQAILSATSIKASLKGNTLLARHEHYTVRIEVVPAKSKDSQNGPIRAVVRVTAELPSPSQRFFSENRDSIMATFNSFASLTALYCDGGKIISGSRLTIYENEDAWQSLHLPLLTFTAIAGSEAIFGAIRRSLKEVT